MTYVRRYSYTYYACLQNNSEPSSAGFVMDGKKPAFGWRNSLFKRGSTIQASIRGRCITQHLKRAGFFGHVKATFLFQYQIS